MSEAVDHPQASTQLGEREAAILAFEREWASRVGSREQEIRERFDMSTPRYHQVLNALIDRPEALAADPLLVKRLRRRRENRKQARSAVRLAR